MERLLPVLQRAVCVLVLFICSLSVEAQALSFTPPTFQNNCAALQFCVTGGPDGDGLLFAFQSRDASGNFLQGGTSTNRCFTITQPANTVTCTVYQRQGLGQPLATASVTLPSTVSDFFRLTATSTNTTVCPHRSRVIGVRAARCIGINDWTRSVFGYNGAPSNGLTTEIRNRRITEPNVIGLRSDMDLVITDGLGFRPGDRYRIRVTGRVELSDRSGSVNIYVNTSNTCRFGGPSGPIIILKEGADLSAEEVAVLERAATTGLTDEEWEEYDVDGLLERGFDVDHTQTTVSTGPLGVMPQLEVFPNPANGQTTVRYDVRPDRIDLVDLNGRTIRSLAGSRIGEYQSRLDLNDLPSGLYLVAALTSGDRTVTKLRVR